MKRKFCQNLQFVIRSGLKKLSKKGYWPADLSTLKNRVGNIILGWHGCSRKTTSFPPFFTQIIAVLTELYWEYIFPYCPSRQLWWRSFENSFRNTLCLEGYIATVDCRIPSVAKWEWTIISLALKHETVASKDGLLWCQKCDKRTGVPLYPHCNKLCGNFRQTFSILWQ